MMMTKRLALIACLGFLVGACTSKEAILATAYAQTKVAQDEMATLAAQTEIPKQQTRQSEETSTAASATSSAYAEATKAKKTEIALDRAATRQATNDLATEQAEPMAARVQELVDYGYLESGDGVYHALPPFYESWAQLGWYMWWPTEYTPSDFVIRADADWNSASDRAETWGSGCGFVFREQGSENHYLAYLGLDGWVYFGRSVNGVQASLGRGFYGKVGYPNGGAELMLVVEGDRITFFVNDEKVHTRQDTALKSGKLGLTLLSGTNRTYGTRCKMSNIDLWIMR